jgi:hypothetical protein
VSGVISEGGERLRAFLDGTHVETEWIANYHVVWQTGQRNGPAQGDPAHHTHCSAYVAAAALYLDIYILSHPIMGNCIWRTRKSTGWAALGVTRALRPRRPGGAV